MDYIGENMLTNQILDRKTIIEEAGSHFDPALVDIFKLCAPQAVRFYMPSKANNEAPP